MASLITLPHLQSDASGFRLVVDDQPFFILGAETHNSTSSDPALLRRAFKKLVRHYCNTALVPVTWEMVEPVEGAFDFKSMEWTIALAREHGLRVVLLWFGTWKNGQSTYVPEWVKLNGERFPRAMTELHRLSRTLSAWGGDTLAADCRAFVRLMSWLRENDEARTVLMVQVQNEPGLLGAARDLSPAATAAYEHHVPVELAEGGRSWIEEFGDSADETFMAWGTARFIGEVARAGKAEYPLPMFSNAWLDQPDQKPGVFPSGGPVARHHDIWRAAAPSLDFLAPDIYDKNYADRCAEFAKPGINPLFVPETGVLHAMGNVELVGNVLAARAVWSFAEHRALGFSPFGLDAGEDVLVLAEIYRELAGLSHLILDTNIPMRGVLQQSEGEVSFELGPYRILAVFDVANQETQPGYGFVMLLGSDEYLVGGANWTVYFQDPAGERQADFLWVDEGKFKNAQWHPGRRLNGDDTWSCGLRLPTEFSLRRCRVYQY